MKSSEKLVFRPRQEQLLHLLRDHGSMAPGEIWQALGVSRQGAMDVLQPLLDAGLIEKVGGKKTGRYTLKNQWTKPKLGLKKFKKNDCQFTKFSREKERIVFRIEDDRVKPIYCEERS